MSVHNSCRLALATCSQIPGAYPDDRHLIASLQRLGVDTKHCIWNDPAVDWSRFDAVLIRTTWDYFKNYAAFLRWLDELPIPTINAKPLLRWNADKRYLLELERKGIEIIPTRFAAGHELAKALGPMRGSEVVVKPTVSGGAWHTLRGVVGDGCFEQSLAQLPPELDYMVQAFVPEIVAVGEWSLLFFEGRYSHAVMKRPAAGDYRVQGDFGGSVEALEPGPDVAAAARRVLAATTALGHEAPAYARVDGVVVGGRFLLMELEVIEPSLFLSGRPEAAERFAGNLRGRLAAMA